nr:MAG TPA: hypothetical protein [Caudoviricetes sp.]
MSSLLLLVIIVEIALLHQTKDGKCSLAQLLKKIGEWKKKRKEEKEEDSTQNS